MTLGFWLWFAVIMVAYVVIGLVVSYFVGGWFRRKRIETWGKDESDS